MAGTPALIRNLDLAAELARLAEGLTVDWIDGAARALVQVEQGMRRNLLRSLSLDAMAVSLGRRQCSLISALSLLFPAFRPALNPGPVPALTPCRDRPQNKRATSNRLPASFRLQSTPTQPETRYDASPAQRGASSVLLPAA